MKKLFISPSSLLEDSYELAWKIYESGYLPNYIIGVWRGGSPIGIAVQELLHVLGVTSDHIAIRTSYYTGIETVKDDVQVHGLSYVIKKIQSEDRLLIVDDVHDTGISIEKIISTLTKACKKILPTLKSRQLISNQVRIRPRERQTTSSMKQTNGLFFLMNLMA